MARNVPPEPPYRWLPLGTRWDVVQEPGRIVAWRHAAWRVIEVNPVPESDRTDRDRGWRTAPRMVIIRPVAVTGDDPRARDHDVHLRLSGTAHLDVYPDEHYPVCARCGEPVPCREQKAAEIAGQAAKTADAHALPGVCPACQEPITARQKAITFDENLYVPFGPPVSFHSGRGECRYSAANYERKWADAAPGRKLTLSCRGHVYQHADGPECSEGPDCPGITRTIRHDRWSQCDDRCLRCRDAQERRAAEIKARNAAGDWTVW